MKRILILGGPSGVGKSFFASHVLKPRGWKHVDLDSYSGGGVDERLKPGWEAFFNFHKPDRLHEVLCCQYHASEKIVISPTGGTLFDPEHLSAAKGRFLIAYLWGSLEACLRICLVRERRVPRGVNGLFWLGNNQHIYFWLDFPFNAPLRVNAFTENGERRPDDDVLADFERLMA